MDDLGRIWLRPRGGVGMRVRLRIARGQRLDPAQDLLLAARRRLPPPGSSRTRCRISADQVGLAAWV